MIKLEHVVLASPEQMEFIIEGMRNPMNSWEKSDSQVCNYIFKGCCGSCEKENNGCRTNSEENDFYMGINDYTLMQNMPSKEIARIPRVTICSNLSLCDNEFRIMERVNNADQFNADDVEQVPDYNISDKIRVDSNPISPEHYKRLSPEPKDVIRSWGLNFNLGSAVKYISRAGHKDDIIQDLKKAQQFIQFEIDYLEGDKEK